MNKPARTLREAYAAVVMEEIEGLTLRLENVTRAIAEHESSNKQTSAALLSSADNFKGAVTKFSETATAQVRESVEHHAHVTINKTRAEIERTMQDVAQHAWRKSAMDEADKLTRHLRGLSEQFKPVPAWQRLAEIALGGFVGAALVAVLLLAMGKM